MPAFASMTACDSIIVATALSTNGVENKVSQPPMPGIAFVARMPNLLEQEFRYAKRRRNREHDEISCRTKDVHEPPPRVRDEISATNKPRKGRIMRHCRNDPPRQPHGREDIVNLDARIEIRSNRDVRRDQIRLLVHASPP